MRPGILLYSILAFVLGCSGEVNTPEKLMQYVSNPENGLIKEKQIDGIGMRVAYRPHDLILAQNLNSSNKTERIIDSLRNELTAYTYFVLKLDRNKKEIVNHYANTPQFEKAVNYISFVIGQDIRLLHEQDTIPVFDFIADRAFGMSQSTDVLVVFKSNILKKNGTCVFQLNDNFFGTGLNQFEFKISDIKSTPSLSL